MLRKTDLVNNLHIASPCPVGWDKMKGDDRARYCEECKLHVYNIADMTRRQAEALITKTEGRLCLRLYRRADGTVLTRDCPVGLRAIRRRIGRMAGATITAVLSFCFAIMGQKQSQDDQSCSRPQEVSVVRKTGVQAQKGEPAISGVIIDPNGAVIPGVSVKLVRQDKNEIIRVATNDEGVYMVPSLGPGVYSLEIKSTGFASGVVHNLEVKDQESLTVNITMGLEPGVIVFVGIVGETPFIDKDPGHRTTFGADKIKTLPY